MTWYPHVTVAAVIEKDGRFLMVEEEVSAGLVYNQPAGHLERGESLIEAVIRETLEETAWRMRPTALIGLHQWTSSPDGETFLRVCFSGTLYAHEPQRRLDTGIHRVLWLSRDDLVAQPARHRSPMVMRAVDDYLAGRWLPLDFVTCISDAVTTKS